MKTLSIFARTFQWSLVVSILTAFGVLMMNTEPASAVPDNIYKEEIVTEAEYCAEEFFGESLTSEYQCFKIGSTCGNYAYSCYY